MAVQTWLDRPPGTHLEDVVREALADAGRGFAENSATPGGGPESRSFRGDGEKLAGRSAT